MRILFGLRVVLMCVATGASALTIDASTIVKTGEALLRGKSTQVLMRMQIHHAAYKRELRLRSWTLGTEKSFVAILEPAKEVGISSLRLKTDMWNYFPKTEQTVRVPTSVMLQSWMGSDFTNDDLMKLSSLSTDYQHKLLRKETLNGSKVNTILCTPNPGAPVVWGKILYSARLSDHLPMKEEYFDEKGKLVRTLNLSQFKKMDDRVIPTVLEIQNADTPGEFTTVTYEKILFDRALDDSYFRKEKIQALSLKALHQTEGWSEVPLAQLIN